MLWTLRYKHRQHMVDAVIETYGTEQAEADRLAAYFVRTRFGDSGRVIFVKPLVAITSAEMKSETEAETGRLLNNEQEARLLSAPEPAEKPTLREQKQSIRQRDANA